MADTSDNSSKATPHDPLQREWLRLGEVINLARGATTDLERDWPPPVPWLGRFADLKAAWEHDELQLGPRVITANKYTSTSLENLWRFAVRRDDTWQWLRDFCQRWAAVRGVDLSSLHDDSAPGDAPTTPKHPGGRPREYDREAFNKELLRLANTPDGLPERPQLFRHMADWCSEEWDDIPADSSIRYWIAKVYPPNSN